MAPSPKYPLDAAETVRKMHVDDARKALAEALASLDRKQAELERARADVADYGAETRHHLSADEGAGASALTGSSLARRDDFARARRDGAQRRAATVLVCEGGVAKASRAVDVARDALGERRADARVVELHRERWIEEERGRAIAKEEAELEDRPNRKPYDSQ